jgi:hypothetical protein
MIKAARNDVETVLGGVDTSTTTVRGPLQVKAYLRTLHPHIPHLVNMGIGVATSGNDYATRVQYFRIVPRHWIPVPDVESQMILALCSHQTYHSGCDACRVRAEEATRYLTGGSES